MAERTRENLERALSEALKLAPYGLMRTDIERIRKIADGTYVERKESESRRRLMRES